jgi:hypothetical protein
VAYSYELTVIVGDGQMKITKKRAPSHPAGKSGTNHFTAEF